MHDLFAIVPSRDAPVNREPVLRGDIVLAYILEPLSPSPVLLCTFSWCMILDAQEWDAFGAMVAYANAKPLVARAYNRKNIARCITLL